MKTFAIMALTLILTAATMVGCGCTNQNMDPTTMPTVLPTNEEIWNSTETTTRMTTEATTVTDPTGSHSTTDTTGTTESTDTSRSINETEVQNRVNAHTDMMNKIRENEKAAKESSADSNARRAVPGAR